ncbi:DUF839 domain-containing protein [bacterium]|nr:DUF839 domain-containing protein [bacterium]MBU1994231.1 DUF839 domain-containing protein [bacterium]
MKKWLSLAATTAIMVAGFTGCNSEDSTASTSEAGIVATKVEFIGMAAPANADEMSTSYSTAKIRVYTSATEYQDHNLSYNTLFNVKDKVGTNPYQAGQLYNAKMEPLKDAYNEPALAETPDGNSLLNVDGNLFLVSHLEYDWIISDGTSAPSRMPMGMLLTSIAQDSVTGVLTATEQKALDFSSVDGLWIPCFASQTPWNTHLGSEEDYDLYFQAGVNEATTQKGLTALNDLYFENTKVANPYHYGYITEVKVNKDSSYEIAKHYSMGKGTWEMSKVMADKRTAYFGDDGSNVGLFMYVADAENALTAGTLYAAKWNQTSVAGATDGGSANLTWYKLGHATDAQVKMWAEQYTFGDIFEHLAEVSSTTDTAGYTAIKAGSTGIEYIKLKSGMETVAAFLEPRRYAAYIGATTEWNKMEGIAANTKDKKLYMAMSYIDKGMMQDDGFAKDDIKIAKNNCGATYEMNLQGGVSDTQGTLINSEYVAVNMYVPAALLGEEIAADANGNTCNVDKIANTDNVFYSEKMRTVFVGEDSGTHTNNFVWAYNIDTAKLSRIASVVAGGESTGLQVVDNMNGHAYIMSNVQHQADFTKTTPDALKTELWLKIDKFNAPVGYIGGIPGLK